jgi:putative membrane protein
MKRTAAMLVLGLAGALAASGAMAENSGMKNGTAQTKATDKASKSFIKDAIEGDIAEVDVGKLARDKGQSQGVKDFAAMLIKDHSEHKAKAEEVASQIGVKPPTGSSMTEKATYAKLKLLSGASFDTAFAKATVKDHQQDIKEFQKESTKSDPVGKLAQETLPVLHKHLEAAQQLAAQQKQSSR